MREAMYWSVAGNNALECGLCPHKCLIAENATGSCGVRTNMQGVLEATGYGIVSSIALDPIEKKPLYMFNPGRRVLSIGGYGCNLKCPFCQNFEISTVFGVIGKNGPTGEELGDSVGSGTGKSINSKLRKGEGAVNEAWGRSAPEDILMLARQTIPNGNIGLAYTYNEPLTGYEFLYDCAKLIREAGLKNVIVTNGYINEGPLDGLLPLIDAMNIDLKGFTEEFYRKIGGSLDEVKRTIVRSFRSCHVEVTTLIIPGENEKDVRDLAKWLSSVDPGIPLHISRFFPRYKYSGRDPTPKETLLALCDIAGKHLRNVFAGNIR